MRYPEAGGSSSFARHAFNEVVSFGAAWAQMLNYIITIAISAFFVPHYLSIFWEPLKENPWDVVVGAVVIVLLVGVNIVGVKEAAKLNVTLAVVDFATQVLLVLLGFALIFSPATLTNVDLGVAPTWANFFLAIPVAMIAYTGIETVSNLAEEARDPSRSIPALDPAGRDRRLRDLLHPAGDRALGAAGRQLVDGDTRRCSGCRPRRAASRTTRCSAWWRTSGWTASLLDALEIYVGVLAATILFIAANAGVIGASRITYSMASYRQLPERVPAAAPALQDAVAGPDGLRRRRVDHRPPPRADRLPRDDVLVRRDALVHDRARLAGRAAGAPPRRGARLPGAAEHALPRRRLAALRDPRRARDGPRLARRGRGGAGDAMGRPGVAGGRLRRLHRLPQAVVHIPLRETVRAPAIVLGPALRSSTERSSCR